MNTIVYEIIEADYDKYIEYNGVLKKDTPLAIEIKNNDWKYFCVKKDGKIINDFLINTETNHITLDRLKFKDLNYINQVFAFLKSKYDFIIEYVPIEMTDIIDIIENNFNVESKIVEQEGFNYKKYKIILK